MARRRSEYEEFSIAQYLTRPFKAVWSWGSRLAEDGGIRERGSNSVVEALLFPLRFLFACILFLVNSWAVTRHIRPFLWGVPSLIAVIGVGGAAWLDYYRLPNKVNKSVKYYEKFVSEPERGPRIARHFALKKVGLQPENLSAKFDLAAVWDAYGALEPVEGEEAYHYLADRRAEDLMHSLADNDHVMAHVWFARKYLTKPQSGLSDEERSRSIDRHLERALELDPESNAAKIAKADHFLFQATRFSEGSPEYNELLVKASEQLIQVSDSDTGEIIWHLPKLMKVLFDLDDAKRADRVFKSSKKMLYQFMRKFPADERVPQIWLVLINSSIQLKDYQDAKAMIDEGKRQTNDPNVEKMFDELSALLLIRQVDDLKDLDSEENFKQALGILSGGLEATPSNPLLSSRIVQFIVPVKADGKVYTDQLERFESDFPAARHLLLGIHEVMKGNALGGTKRWEIANRQSNKTELILFSMIRSLIAQSGDRFDNRRDVIALAIEMYPNQGLFYFLRGNDFFNEGNYSDAVPDLEQAAQLLQEPANFEIHVQLAKCFKAMQDQEKYDNQRRTLQRMVQRTGPGQREILENYISKLDEE